MSSDNLSLVLSPEAESDLSDILQYSYETWGEAQVYLYRAILDKAFSNIQKNPKIGYARPELSPEYRSLIAGRHTILYRIEPQKILVSRILHVRMNIGGQF